MSKVVHPLFLTRGVPGTHDVNLIMQTFKNLKKKFKSVLIQNLTNQKTTEQKRQSG